MDKVWVSKRALLLWIVLVPGGMALGITIGTWILPLAIALNRDGLDGLASIPVNWGTASVPRWIPRSTGKWLDWLGGLLGLGLAAAVGRSGTRLAHWLVVHKLGWMTEEDVQRANRRPQIM
jgi:hypothetical protein